MSARRTLSRLIPGLLSALLLTACAGVSGTPVAGEIDVRTIDAGSYPTDPLDYRMVWEHYPNKTADLAAIRLAGYVPTGTEIDSELRFRRNGSPITNVYAGAQFLLKADVPIIERNGMLFGFTMSAASTPRQNGDAAEQIEVNALDSAALEPNSSSVHLTVLQFPDGSAATRAVVEMEAADFAVAAENVPVTLDRYPDAKSHWRPGVPTLGALAARGNYLINVFVKRPTAELGDLTALAQKTLDAQIPLLDQLPPLSSRDVLRLDYDPQGMMRRILHPDRYVTPYFGREGVYTPRAYLHTTDDQEQTRRVLESAGVDAVAELNSLQDTTLIRARDGDAAAALLNDFKSNRTDSADAPTGVPDTFCHRYVRYPKLRSLDEFHCYVRYDRYVGIVQATQLPDAQQKAAAQYALLAKSAWM
ncbi:hypothetical protein [Nocardia sp. NPDC057668]|uniref:DUF7373 family lipoprotein n=1 Tax=Nocardia sp. NPDC057668 TaxID=3346202 RepID=UPI00366AF9A1